MRGSRITGGSRIPAGSRTLVGATLTGAAAFAVYWTTLLPGVGAWDTAEAQVALPLMGTMHPTGFPAYVLLGWLASVVLQPLGAPAFRINVLSAALVASAVAAAVAIQRRLGVPLPIAVAAALGFALSPITWAMGSAADVHALHVALVALLVLALVRWDDLVAERRARPWDDAAARRADRALLLAAALFGLSLANHALTLLLVPAVALFVVAVEPGIRRRRRLVVTAIGTCLAVAAVLYLELPLRAGPFRAPFVYGAPDTWAGFWEIVLGRQFQGDFTAALANPVGTVSDLAALWSRQFGVLLLLVPPAFLVTAIRHPRYALLTGVAAAVTCLFASSYVNAAIDRYHLVPVLFAWTWLGVAAAAVVDAVFGRSRTGDGADDPMGAATPGWVGPRAAFALLVGAVMLVPTLSVLYPRWQGADRSHETAMQTWTDDLFARAEPDAVVISWWSYSTPIWYGQLVEGRRPDIRLVDDRTRLDEHLGGVADVIDANLGSRPVYVIRATGSELQDLEHRYAIEPVDRPAGVVRVTGRVESRP